MSLSDGIDDYISSIVKNLGEGRVGLPPGIARRIAEASSGVSIPQLEGAGFGSSVVDAFRRRYLSGSDFGRSLLDSVSGSPGGFVAKLGGVSGHMPYSDGAPSHLDGSMYSLALDAPAEYSGHDASTSLPVASDVWYFLADDTVIPYVDAHSHQVDEERTRLLEAYLLPLIERCLSGLKPLRRPARASDVAGGVNVGRYTIKRMRHESWNPRQSQRFPGSPSYYSKTGSYVGINDVCAYLAFPVGPLGVMQVLSIVVPDVSKRMEDTGQWSGDWVVKSGGTTGHAWGGLFPHIVNSDDNACRGLHMIESMYTPVSLQLEYPAPMYYGYEHESAHQWMRYYLKKSDVWPVPGSPIFMIGRPSPLHCWWFQESSPLVFSGGNFETEYYTSATVVRTLAEDEVAVGTIGQILLVEIYGEQLYVRASDFFPYEDGSRVALLKRVGSANFSFHWGQCVDYASAAAKNAATSTTSAAPYVVYEWLLAVPVSFYEEG